MGNYFSIVLLVLVSGFSQEVMAQLQDNGAIGRSAEITIGSGEVAAAPVLNPNNYPVYYAVDSDLTLYSEPDSTFPYREIAMREPVFVLTGVDDKGWLKVRTKEGSTGYVPATSVSDLWIKISKKTRTVRIYRGDALYRTLPADLAINFFSDKIRRGGQEKMDHWRTPEGVFYIVSKNPNSQFHKAFVLNYPGTADAERGLRHKLITRDEYNRIVRADEKFEMPPMSTALGGYIEIHGDGTGARTNWTRGCIAIRNADIDELWDEIHVGTPVLIEK